MKNLNKLLFATALAVTFGLANNASAQYRPTGEDGITASPKLRQMLSERPVVAAGLPATPTVVVTRQTPGLAGVAASPKLSQQLAERTVVTRTPAFEVTLSGYQATGQDGITASPKLRQQLNERGPTFMIAPVK